MGLKGGAGKLNRRITFQRLPPESGTKDGFGELTAEPTDDIVNVPAAYETLGGGRRGFEFLASEKRNSESTARFRIRYRPDLDLNMLPATHRIKRIHNPRLHTDVVSYSDIKAAYDLGERHEEIIIEVSEVL